MESNERNTLSMKLKELTKAEEQVMQVLWNLKKGFVNDILDQFPKPKPAYNTVSTIVRILVKKGVVAFKAYGNSHEYYPAISKKEYTYFCLKNIVGNYFDGSFEELVSFFARENNLNVSELDELMSHVQQDLKNKTDDSN